MNKATRVRRVVIAVLSVVGAVFVVGAVATELLGLDLTPGFGVLQTLAFLIGLTVLTIAAVSYTHLDVYKRQLH